MKNHFFNRRVGAGLLFAILLLAFVRVPLGIAPAPDRGVVTYKEIPYDLFYSFLRMLAAYAAAIVFSIFIGTLAATAERRARILLPVIDILQSVPILGFFPVAVYWFVRVGGQHFGVEASVVFLIFTCQSWNLVFGVYDGIKSVPAESMEAARSLGLGPLAIFRQVYLPAAFPRIVDNSIISWANGWYFLMACEIVALGPLAYRVPGIGAFLQSATQNKHWALAAAALGSLIALILAMDLLIWRPLRSLSQLFKFESTKKESSAVTTGDRLLSLYRNATFFAPLRTFFSSSYRAWIALEAFLEPPTQSGARAKSGWKWGSSASLALFWTSLVVGMGVALGAFGSALVPPWRIAPLTLLAAIFTSALRILAAYVVSLAWILPLVFWIHRRPKLMRAVQSSAQIAASVPATAFFPLIVLAALKFFGTVEIAVIILLTTGMQWYLLFNILGGASSLPNDLREVADSLGVNRWLYVRRIFLPAIVPALVTGSITAVGGGWNALVISEYARNTGSDYSVFGIGAAINRATYEWGDEKLLALSLLLMVAFIVILNRFMWQPLYDWAERKFRLEG